MVFFPLILGLLPSFVWLLFYLKEDETHPEPKILLLYVFLSGAASTFFVFGPQLALSDWLPQLGIQQYSILSLFILGAIEEVFKFLAVYLTVKNKRDFDEPIDAMIYMIVASLGFAAIENIASAMQGGVSIDTFQVAALRFIGATLLHSLSSALVGFYWGLAMVQKKDFFKMIVEGLGVATLLHTIFNSLIIKYGPETLTATLFLVAISFFVFNDFEKLKNPA